MSYRKFKADHLFTGTEMLGSKNVLILKQTGEVEAIIDEENVGDDVEIFNGIISPGFINAHCHLELSHMKGLIPEKTGLVDFVYKVVTERHHADEEILNAIDIAESEMLANGIVAVGDICNNILTLSQKQKQKLAYYNFIEASGWLPAVSEMRFEKTLEIFREFKQQLAHGYRQSIVPHAPYSVSEVLWQLITPYFQNKVVTIHNQETLAEDELFVDGTGDLLRMYRLMNIDNSFYSHSKKSSLQTFFSKLTRAASIILVHNTYTSQADIDYVTKNACNQLLSFCVCANANLYIENAYPPIDLLMKNSCNIILGTDSLASNWNLNLLDEMKTIQKKFPAVTLESMLQWGTMNGAKALQMDENLGSFEKGKRPGVICLNRDLGGLKRLL